MLNSKGTKELTNLVHSDKKNTLENNVVTDDNSDNNSIVEFSYTHLYQILKLS